MRRRWWLLILLIVLGACSAVAVPNVLTAMQRSKQKRTMADLRTLASAVEARAMDTNDYPVVHSLDELAHLLEPKYVKKMPRTDGWGKPLRYEAWKEAGDSVPQHYGISSAGADGLFEKASARQYAANTATDRFARDIVYSNGEFLQYPEGG